MNQAISIIMTSYNYAEFIERAINSVIAQTYENWELIIVDDGSVDNSLEIISKYAAQNEKIKLYRHKDGLNKGLKESLLLGINCAKNEYIAFLESDDYWDKSYLQEKIDIIHKYPAVGLIFNDISMFGDKTAIDSMNHWVCLQRKVLSKLTFPSNVSAYFFMMNIIPTFSSVMVKKELLLACDFNASVQVCLDWLLWIQISINNDFYFIDKKLTFWMKHKSSYTNIFKKKRNADYNFYKEKLKYLNHSKINKSALFFLKIINFPLIEKLFRPEVRKINQKILAI